MNARGNTMVRYALALLVAFAVIGAADWAAAAQQVGAVPTGVTGRVEFRPTPTAAFQPLRVGVAVYEGADIRAYANSSAELKLPDGSTLTVAENTRFIVTKLDFQGTQMKSAFFHLAAGKLSGLISKAAASLVAATQKNFAISTPTAVAAVRGSRVVATYNPATRETIFTCTDGVAVIRDAMGRSVTIRAGQSTVLAPPPAPAAAGQPPAPLPPAPVAFQSDAPPANLPPSTAAAVRQTASTNVAEHTQNRIDVTSAPVYNQEVGANTVVITTPPDTVMSIAVTSSPTAPPSATAPAGAGGRGLTDTVPAPPAPPLISVSPTK